MATFTAAGITLRPCQPQATRRRPTCMTVPVQTTCLHARLDKAHRSRSEDVSCVAPKLVARSRPAVRCLSASVAQPLATVGDDSEYEEVNVTLKKPLGVVFAQKPSGGAVFVEEVTPGGHADGLVRVGDILAGCSAYMLKEDANTDYSHGQTPYRDFERVEFNCLGQTFQTCMSALKSNNTRWGVTDITLVLRRPKAT